MIIPPPRAPLAPRLGLLLLSVMATAAATGAEHPCIPPFPSWSRAPDRCAAPPPAPPAGARANEHRVDTVRTLTRSYNENRGATTL